MAAPIQALVIEDSPADYLLIERHLRKSGANVQCRRVASLVEVKEVVGAGACQVVLSDYNLPGMEFGEVLAFLREHDPDLPLIMVSGHVGEERAVELLKEGLWDFVLKNSLVRLVPAIERALTDAAARQTRRAMEQSLREREAQYRAVLETSNDGFLVCDLHGRLLEVNEAYLIRSGYDRKELLRMSIADLEAVSSEALIGHQARVRRTGGDRFETRHRMRDGSLWAVELNTTWWDGHGGRFFSFVRDLRHRKRSEALLRARVELSDLAAMAPDRLLLRLALDTAETVTGSSFGLYYSVEPDQKRVRLRACSTAGLRRFSLGEFGAAWKELTLADGTDPVAEALVRSSPVIRNRPGAACWVGVPDRPFVRTLAVPVVRHGSALAVLAVDNKHEDYTQDDVVLLQELGAVLVDQLLRRQAEAALRESENRLNLALTVAGMGVYEWNVRTNTIHWSAECYRIYGVDVCDGTIEAFTNRLHPEDAPWVMERAHQALAERRDFAVEFRIVRPDGTVRWLSDVARGRYDEDGHPLGLVGTIRDITDQRAAVTELEAAKRQAEAGSAAKSQFLSTMSHELRTPLNAIIGYCEWMRMTETRTDRLEHLDIIHKAGHHLLRLIQDILDLSKIEAGKVTLDERDFDLMKEIETIITLFQPEAARKRVEFGVVIPPTVPTRLHGDPALLRQILMNLVGNAFKFTERGRVMLQIEACRSDEDGTGVTLLFHVTDTGVGIKPENQSRIFEMFEQEDNSYRRRIGGSGLGLAISRKLAALLGGRLWLESAVGVGSRFSFTVHYRTSVMDSVPAAALTVSDVAPVNPIRILVVEDDPFSRQLMVQVLEGNGYLVTCATTGAEALSRLGERRCDLVLMDIQLPVMTGIEATQSIRAGLVPGCDRDVPIIAVTAYAMGGDRRRFLDAGVTEYLSKPMDLGKLLEAVRRCTSMVG